MPAVSSGAEKTLPAFFVVAGTATGGRNDLAVTNKFDVVMRQIMARGMQYRLPNGLSMRLASNRATRISDPLRYRLRRSTGGRAGWRGMIKNPGGKPMDTAGKQQILRETITRVNRSKKESSEMTAAEGDE